MQANTFNLDFGEGVAFRLPCPTHEVGSGRELLRGSGKMIRRCPTVKSAGRVATLLYPALTAGQLERNGRQHQVETKVHWLPMISSIEAVKADVVGRFGAEIGHVDGVWSEAGTCRAFTLDLGALGWCPGDEIVYVLMDGPIQGALCFQPTHWLRYEWDSIECVTE